MEQKEQTPSYPGSIELPPEHLLEELITTLMRGKWVIVGVFLLVLSATALYTFLSKPVYEATSMVLIDAKGRGGSLPFLDVTGAASASKITNELETLKARSTAEAVAQVLEDRTYLDAARKRFIPIIRAEVDGRSEDIKDSLASVTARLLKAVDFAPVKESDIIKVTVRRNDPLEAAVIANTYTQVYAERNMSASRTRSRALREFLQSQMSSKHENLDSTEHALQTYMRSSGMVSLDAEANKVVNQLSQLEATRDGIEVDITTRTKTLNSYKQELATQEPNVAKAIGESNDTYLRMLQEQLARLEVQRDVVIAQNPELADEKIYSEKLKEIDGQIASLKKNLKARTEIFLGSLVPGDRTIATEGGSAGFLSQVKQRIIEQQIELDGLVARKGALNGVIADYERQFNQIPQKSVELAKLQRARLSSEKLYLLVEEKFNEAAITETSEFGYVNIMDPAVVPVEPVSPKVMANLLLGGILGLFLGVGTVVIRAQMDDRIKSPEDLKKHGVTPLATIGRIEVVNRKNGKSAIAPSSENGHLNEHLIAFLSPLSATSEGYRHLCTSIEYSGPDHPTRTVLVTSASPKEGKSTTVANLAISFAQGESRVLLIDADLRRPSMQTLFGLDKGPGLTDVLFEKRVFKDVVHRRVIENLDVLCCGTAPPNPAAVLKSHKMRAFMDDARASYDIVLFDSPPLLAVTDAAILSRMVDAILIVTSAGQTGLTSLDRVAEILRGVGRTLTGVVLNNFDTRRAYGGYYGRYRRDHYSYGQGYTANGNGQARKRNNGVAK